MTNDTQLTGEALPEGETRQGTAVALGEWGTVTNDDPDAPQAQRLCTCVAWSDHPTEPRACDCEEGSRG